MLELVGIKKDYISGNEVVPALKGVTLAFRKNEFAAILGVSGCGKTTLLNIVGGLDKYSDGDLIINGTSTKQFKSSDWDTYRNSQIGFVFQSYNLIPHLTVLKNVELALTLSGVSRKERRQRATNALIEVGLQDKLRSKPNQLSGGQAQRVSIARALVNNPEIILADEPTGALDTQTSVQIMELLAKIAKTKLVIMVTHNPELAAIYSTRTIKLLDGLVIRDSAPYKAERILKDTYALKSAQNTQDSIGNASAKSATGSTPKECAANIEEKKDRLKEQTSRAIFTNYKSKVKAKKAHSSMSFFTALSLSTRNLFTKKMRTGITAFAGSIGIIGVGLVLAINNGFNAYVSNMEKNDLAGYPISIMKYALNSKEINSEVNGGGNTEKPNAPILIPAYPSDNIIYNKNESKGDASTDSGSNPLKPPNMGSIDFVQQAQKMIKNMMISNKLNQQYFEYLAKMDKKLGVTQYVYSIQMRLIGKNNASETFLVDNNKVNWSELSGGKSYVDEHYDLIDGEYPVGDYQAVVVVNKYNQISQHVLAALGLDDRVEVRTSEIMNSNLKIVDNNGFYKSENGKFIAAEKESEIDALYNDTANAHPIKIVGILRVKSTSNSDAIRSGIGYPHSLVESAFARAQQSDIVIAQKADPKTDVTTGNKFSVDILSAALGFKEADMYTTALSKMGAIEMPESAYVYPYGFREKVEVKKYLDDYNVDKPAKEKIRYVDMAENATAMAREIIDIVTIVLACFAGISLLVSSVMIGVITYVSVVERTKEIGILRSMGARKIDISNVFNAETVIIGLTAGFIGVGVTYLLSIPINMLINYYAGIDASIAALAPLTAVALIVVSTALTFIAGLVPATIASKKDPVVALRTE